MDLGGFACREDLRGHHVAAAAWVVGVAAAAGVHVVIQLYMFAVVVPYLGVVGHSEVGLAARLERAHLVVNTIGGVAKDGVAVDDFGIPKGVFSGVGEPDEVAFTGTAEVVAVFVLEVKTAFAGDNREGVQGVEAAADGLAGTVLVLDVEVVEFHIIVQANEGDGFAVFEAVGAVPGGFALGVGVNGIEGLVVVGDVLTAFEHQAFGKGLGDVERFGGPAREAESFSCADAGRGGSGQGDGAAGGLLLEAGHFRGAAASIEGHHEMGLHVGDIRITRE